MFSRGYSQSLHLHTKGLLSLYLENDEWLVGMNSTCGGTVVKNISTTEFERVLWVSSQCTSNCSSITFIVHEISMASFSVKH